MVCVLPSISPSLPLPLSLSLFPISHSLPLPSSQLIRMVKNGSTCDFTTTHIQKSTSGPQFFFGLVWGGPTKVRDSVSFLKK
jgi:hypothetical protein